MIRGYGSFVHQKDTDGVYRIPLRPENLDTPNFDFAQTLKAILWAPGCQIQLVSSELVTDFARDALCECHPLPTVTLHGAFSPPPAAAGPLLIEVHYQAIWDHGFFPIGDGPVTDLQLASAPFASDGRFTIDIPDFSNDPVTKEKLQSASLKLLVLDANTGNLVAILAPPSDMRTLGDLKILSRYDSEIRFTSR